MASAGEYAAMVVGLRAIRRTARRVLWLPVGRLTVSDDDAADAEYVNECLGIALRMLGVEMEDSIPSGMGRAGVVRVYRHCIGLAYRQAGRLLWGLRFGRIRKNAVPHDAWCNVDTAADHLQELVSCTVDRKGRCLWCFRKKR